MCHILVRSWFLKLNELILNTAFVCEHGRTEVSFSWEIRNKKQKVALLNGESMKQQAKQSLPVWREGWRGRQGWQLANTSFPAHSQSPPQSWHPQLWHSCLLVWLCCRKSTRQSEENYFFSIFEVTEKLWNSQNYIFLEGGVKIQSQYLHLHKNI